MKTIILLAAIHLLYAGSKTNIKIEKKSAAVTVEPIQSFADTITLNGKWYLQPMLASDTAAGKVPFLQIDLAKKIFSGNTGCNTMRGGFQKTDSSLVFNENIITTKMLCTGYNEAAFLKSLLHTNRYKIVKGVLVLMFDETELSRWTRKPPLETVLST